MCDRCATLEAKIALLTRERDFEEARADALAEKLAEIENPRRAPNRH